MDPDLKYLVTTLTSLMQLGCTKNYEIIDVDFVQRKILVANAEGIAKELGLLDRIRYEETNCPDSVREAFDYHGVIVCTYKNIAEVPNAEM